MNEKLLIVSRQFIIEKNKPMNDRTELTDYNINSVWTSMFPDDKNKMEYVDFEKIRKYVNSHNLKYCELDLLKLRNKGAMLLKQKASQYGYYVKLLKKPKNKLAMYAVSEKDGVNRQVGSFVGMQSYIGNLARKKQ
ncbi:MAG: hypothetical protein LUE98_12415 [Tannerellaceae bacterium]|nr:hypothetical protein [Lachnospiraceae bacterium]MCD8178171.1 hypothetical protein [Tannerellaceae bacterium]